MARKLHWQERMISKSTFMQRKIRNFYVWKLTEANVAKWMIVNINLLLKCRVVGIFKTSWTLI